MIRFMSKQIKHKTCTKWNHANMKSSRKVSHSELGEGNVTYACGEKLLIMKNEKKVINKRDEFINKCL